MARTMSIYAGEFGQSPAVARASERWMRTRSKRVSRGNVRELGGSWVALARKHVREHSGLIRSRVLPHMLRRAAVPCFTAVSVIVRAPLLV